MSFAALFLLVIAAVHFRLSTVEALILFGGYAGFAALDRWNRRRERTKIVEDELLGWKPKSDDSEWEDKGNLSRIRLTGENQIIAARIIQALERF